MFPKPPCVTAKFVIFFYFWLQWWTVYLWMSSYVLNLCVYSITFYFCVSSLVIQAEAQGAETAEEIGKTGADWGQNRLSWQEACSQRGRAQSSPSGYRLQLRQSDDAQGGTCTTHSANIYPWSMIQLSSVSEVSFSHGISVAHALSSVQIDAKLTFSGCKETSQADPEMLCREQTSSTPRPGKWLSSNISSIISLL